MPILKTTVEVIHIRIRHQEVLRILIHPPHKIIFHVVISREVDDTMVLLRLLLVLIVVGGLGLVLLVLLILLMLLVHAVIQIARVCSGLLIVLLRLLLRLLLMLGLMLLLVLLRVLLLLLWLTLLRGRLLILRLRDSNRRRRRGVLLLRGSFNLLSC